MWFSNYLAKKWGDSNGKGSFCSCSLELAMPTQLCPTGKCCLCFQPARIFPVAVLKCVEPPAPSMIGRLYHQGHQSLKLNLSTNKNNKNNGFISSSFLMEKVKWQNMSSV